MALGRGEVIALVDVDASDLAPQAGQIDFGESPPRTAVLAESGVGMLVVEPGSLDPAARAGLANAAVEVVTLRFDSLQDVLDSARQLGAALGRSDLGHRWANDTGRVLATISAQSYGRRRPRVALVVEADPLTIVGYRNVLHDLVEVAGADHVLEHAEAPDATLSISAELLTESAPDLVIDLRPAERSGAPLSLDLRVEQLDPARLVPPGADLLEATSILFALFHPAVAVESAPAR